jgi:hypothetical protein
MKPLVRRSLVTLPLTYETIESFYDGSRSGTAEECLRAACESHERLREELSGTTILLSDAQIELANLKIDVAEERLKLAAERARVAKLVEACEVLKAWIVNGLLKNFPGYTAVLKQADDAIQAANG